MKYRDILSEFPSIGWITRTTDRGFGFAESHDGEHFIHISNLVGTRPAEFFELSGARCAFAIGGDPRAQSEGKPSWDSRVVRWVVLNKSFSRFNHHDYAAARASVLREADAVSFGRLLAADWYCDRWRKVDRRVPEAALRSDSALVHEVHTRLKAAQNLEDVIRLLATACESPWFRDAKIDAREVFEQFFQPSEWPRSLAVSDRPLSHYDRLEFLEPECSRELARWIRMAQVVAIDLESDGQTIRQYGWRTSTGSGLRKSQSGLAGAELQAAVDESTQALEHPCLVGHNLLQWDWPILERLGARFPAATEQWDTLLAEWVLQPWSDSHALVVKTNAHSADADAAACYELFEDQAARLAACLPSDARDLGILVDALLDSPERFGAIEAREYPATLHKELQGPALFPRSQRRAFEWQKGCHVELLTDEQRFLDPALDAAVCIDVATAQGTIFAKAIAAVVADALSNGVAPRLSWLPQWLAGNELRDELRKAHAVVGVSAPSSTSNPIYVAEDCFLLGDEELEGYFSNGQLSVRFPEHVAAVWQRRRRTDLRTEEVEGRFPAARMGRRGRALLAVEEAGEARWLLHDPSGMGQGSASWYLLPRLPSWIQPEAREGDESYTPHARVPRWRDGDVIGLDLDRVFVSPDTANRRRYLEDLTHSVLNVVRELRGDVRALVGVLSPEEAESLQRNLTHLGRSSEHPGSPLRRLESLRAKGHAVLCCPVRDIPDFLQAAKRLGIELQVILDQVPLHKWHAILSEPGDLTQSATQDTEEAEIDAVPARPVIGPREVKVAVGTFLEGWLQGLGLTTQQPREACLILDDRLSARHAAIAAGIPRQDIPFYDLRELLDDAEVKRWEYCYPRRDEAAIPEDYESYRNFLEKNWEFTDFRPSQRPAIQQIIGSTKDLLFRLPTGGGKSLVFHLPALLRSSYSGRLSIVITPLRALMRDQVEGLWRKKFIETVDYLSGDRDPWINHEVYQGVVDGRIQLLFIAPERFRVPLFREALERRRQSDGGLEFIVFDEAHCVSDWGFAFRPDYLDAARYVRKEFRVGDRTGNPHRLLLTSATVTQRNRGDLERELGLGSQGEYDDLPADMPHPIQSFIEIKSLERQESREEVTGEKFDEMCAILAKLDLLKSAALVFARSRRDCHRISDALNARASEADSSLRNLRALPFHAGLSDSLKAGAADLLRGKRVNVLVCTKAFGMGMDIPHIHACIHQAPPTYIEDYLQEIGRIGRDREARLSTGHERVPASLLYNADDLELNMSRLHKSALKPPELISFHEYCVARSVSFDVSQPAICLVPSTVRLSRGVEYDESQVTSCLFWLKRMGILEVEGQLPPVLELVLMPKALTRHTAGDERAVRLAQVLLDFARDSQKVGNTLAYPAISRNGNSDFARLVKGLVRGVVALLSKSRPPIHQEQVSPAAFETTPVDKTKSLAISVPVRELLARYGAASSDDVYAGLLELHKAAALKLKRTFHVRTPRSPSGDEYFDLLEHAVEIVSAPTDEKVEVLARSALVERLRHWCRQRVESRESTGGDRPSDLNAKNQEEEEWRIEREVYRALATTLQLMRQCGFELKERFSDEGDAAYVRSIPRSMHHTLRRAIDERLGRMRELDRIIRGIQPNAASKKELQPMRIADLTYITDRIEGSLRMSDLRNTMKLLDSSGLFAFESDSDQHVSIVTLRRTARMEAYDPARRPEDPIQAGYKEMHDRLKLQVLRAQAMVLLVVMPAEGRKKFIDDYFAATKADEIEELLKDSIGAVDDEVTQGNEVLRNLRDDVRLERFTQKFAQLNKQQLEVCGAPFDRNILVNAGPGSGKTHVLMMRCAHLIHEQGVDPSSILVLAFNRSVVYEIRERLRQLFRGLGYGNYASRIDITTFHAFALRYHDPDDPFEEDAVSESVHAFARSMREETGFAEGVAEKYRAILVDEFQDMNEDFFEVVDSLIANCAGGGMVIGDDDQDILTWNRVEWRQRHGGKCPLDAVTYFNRFRDSFKPTEIRLVNNYRSTRQIVERADRMVQRAADRIGFPRVKGPGQLVAHEVSTGAFEEFKSRKEVVPKVQEAVQRGDHVAVLCRSNRECLQVREDLVRSDLVDSDRIKLLGGENFELYKLRASGYLFDLCKRRNDYEFVNPDDWNQLMDDFRGVGFADVEGSLQFLGVLYQLVEKEVGRPTIGDLRTFIHEMRESDVERLKPRIEAEDGRAQITIATIHKVKGLQYDTVIVLPSTEGFPFKHDNGVTIEEAAAEEARLYYVAMTRARTRFYAGWGLRENAWWRRQEWRSKSRNSRRRLKGSPEEIFVSWPGYEKPVDARLQRYIESQVGVEESLTFRAKQMWHRETQVGVLSEHGWKLLGSSSRDVEGRVSNVIRYTCGPHYQEHHRNHWDKLHPTVQERGWFYVVLAESL